MHVHCRLSIASGVSHSLSEHRQSDLIASKIATSVALGVAGFVAIPNSEGITTAFFAVTVEIMDREVAIMVILWFHFLRGKENGG